MRTYGGGAGGVCPNGGAHSRDGSGEYGLRQQVTGDGVAVVYQGMGDDGTIWISLRQGGQWIAPLLYARLIVSGDGTRGSYGRYLNPTPSGIRVSGVVAG